MEAQYLPPHRVCQWRVNIYFSTIACALLFGQTEGVRLKVERKGGKRVREKEGEREREMRRALGYEEGTEVCELC